MTTEQETLAAMRKASDLIDEANGTSDYQTRLVALALIAREYLRRVPPAAAPVPASGPREEQLSRLIAEANRSLFGIEYIDKKRHIRACERYHTLREVADLPAAASGPPCVRCGATESSDGDWYRLCGTCRWAASGPREGGKVTTCTMPAIHYWKVDEIAQTPDDSARCLCGAKAWSNRTHLSATGYKTIYELPAAASELTPREEPQNDLEAIKARCDKATYGPWLVNAPRVTYRIKNAAGLFIMEGNQYGVHGGRDCAADAEFIAHARMDVPNLVREVEALRAAAAPPLSLTPPDGEQK